MLYNPKTQGVGYCDPLLFLQSREHLNDNMVDSDKWKRRKRKLDKSELRNKIRRLKEYGEN